MNASAEVEVRAGEIVAIAIAEYAELEGRKERDLNGAGQGGDDPVAAAASVEFCPVPAWRVAVTVNVNGIRVATIPWSDPRRQCPRSARVGCVGARRSVGLSRRPCNHGSPRRTVVTHIGDIRAWNDVGPVVGTGQCGKEAAVGDCEL